MGNFLSQFVAQLTLMKMLLGVGVFLVSFVGSLALVSFVLVRVPPNYFHHEHTREFWTGRHHAVRWTGIFAKNFLGVVLVVLGVVMSLPGVPGQGLLTILLGVMLLDFPGKRELERKIVSRPAVLHAINRLRARFHKPPLLLE